MTVKESDFLRVFADNTYKLQLQKCCDEFSGRTVRPHDSYATEFNSVYKIESFFLSEHT